MRIRLRPLLALPVALPLALAGGHALAQGVGGPGIVRPQQQGTQAPGPAPALPGLAARRAPAPIAGDPNAALSPNAALFDAINRGDLGAARDAVGRGANVDARNALGLTPLDAAVDQGRHDIAFFLLSARDIARGPATPPPAPVSLSGPPPAVQRSAVREAAPSRAAAALAASAARPAQPVAARLWAGDGGAPRPEIGFLGFDAGRPAGASPPAETSRARR